MDDTILQTLREINDPAEKAALIAESIFDELPGATALVARRCVILHWFDQPIVEALLQDTQLAKSEVKEVFGQLMSLPFIESLAWGLTFQDLTREGLLNRYAISQPGWLRSAAAMAARSYEDRGEDEKIAAEALFCYIVAGDSGSSVALLNKLVKQAKSYKDWEYIENLLRFQEEAEGLSFVEPLSRTEHDWMLRGLVHIFQGKLEAATADYGKILDLNPNNTLAYISRGTIYAEQQRYEKALVEYDQALKYDVTNAQVYISRGTIHARQEHYTEALTDFTTAIRLNPNSAFAYSNKGSVLDDLGQYEEALAVYEEALRLDPKAADVYEGRGNALCGLGQYEEALAAHEEALHLNSNSASACKGKGNALYGLRRYEQAFAAYEEAQSLAPDTPDIYKVRSNLSDKLERNKEIPYIDGENIEPGSIYSLSQQQPKHEVKSQNVYDIVDLEKHKQRNVPIETIPNSRHARMKPSSPFSQKRGSRTFMPQVIRFANALAAVLIVGMLL